MKKNFSKKTVFAKKSLGQNFLQDHYYIQKIIESLQLKPGDTVLEIGPGRGALTKHLIELDVNVVAVEIDKDLISFLDQEIGKRENFRLIEADALDADFCQLVSPEKKHNKIVANLPYYISTAILQKIIRANSCFESAILMLQKEVVERITAQPENRERGYLTVLIEAFADVEKLFDVPPNAFKPIPKVWSSVAKIKLTKARPINLGDFDADLFLKLISAGFTQKRKTVGNNLKNASEIFSKISEPAEIHRIFESADVDLKKRAEELTLDEWLKLVNSIN